MNKPIGLTLCALLALCSWGLLVGATPHQEPPPAETRAIALIVHPDNPMENVEFTRLRGYLKLGHKFWPGTKTPFVLLLPAAQSESKQVLNELVYRMDEARLAKYWTGLIHAGKIPRPPQEVRTTAAAGRMVAASVGAISAVPADEVPEGVRVLQIDGFAPGEKGYPLTYEPETPPEGVSAATNSRS